LSIYLVCGVDGRLATRTSHRARNALKDAGSEVE
jgi:hypothetical protein